MLGLNGYFVHIRQRQNMGQADEHLSVGPSYLVNLQNHFSLSERQTNREQQLQHISQQAWVTLRLNPCVSPYGCEPYMN